MLYRYIGIYLCSINLVSACLCGLDKYFAVHGHRRIRESRFFALAIVGGSFGLLLAMYAFHHKTKHKKFTRGIPLILFFQIMLSLCLYALLQKPAFF